MYEITMLLGSAWFQFRQISPYWAFGLITGSLVSVFLSDKIVGKMSNFTDDNLRMMPRSFRAVCSAGLPLFAASFLGIVSPLCMYGTVPVIAALGRKGVSQHLLAAFMVSSILLNPNIMFLTFVLGTGIALTRLGLSFLSGILAGSLVFLLFRNKQLFSFDRFESQNNCHAANALKKKRFFRDLFKSFRITAPYLLFGITLSTLFDRYIPPDWISGIFGARRGLGVLFATTISIPLYVCGGGTIPLINAWLHAGMGTGDAMAFMLAGPAVKITNLSAVKMIFNAKHFFVYLAYCLAFSMLAGLIISVIF